MKHLPDLIHWVKERERIRERKAAGEPRPWTTDPILAEYRFCNVYREYDKVTLWIQNNWMLPNKNHPNIAFAAGVARMVNHPPTLEALGFPLTWSPAHFVGVIDILKSQGRKVWTSAYMITGGYSAGGETKEVIIARVLGQLYRQLASNPITAPGDSLESAEKKLVVPGIGTFLRGQIIADLKMLDMPLYDADDWYTWCAVGPGSTAGLNYLYDRPQKPIRDEQFRKEVNEVRTIVRDRVGVHLCAQNTQNCLCEFSKYVRTKYYGGKPKARYIPAP